MKPFIYFLILCLSHIFTDASLFGADFADSHASSNSTTNLPLGDATGNTDSNGNMDSTENIDSTTSVTPWKGVGKEEHEQSAFLGHTLPTKRTTVAPLLNNSAWSVFDIFFDNDFQFWDFISFLYTDVCITTCRNFMLEDVTRKWCRRCRCDKVCQVYDDCCPEVYTTLKKSSSDVSVSCLPAAFPDRGNFTPAFLMVDACPEQNTTLSLQCSNSSLHWDHTQPVTGTDLGLTYRNKFCAHCWDVSDYIRWQPSVSISDPSSVNKHMSSKELFFLIVNGDIGSLTYFPPPEITKWRTRSCILDPKVHVIATCNETGLWPHWWETANRACLSLDLPFTTEHGVYGNVFCYFCNSRLTWDEVAQVRPPIYGTDIDDPVNSLSILLDLDETTDAEWAREKSEQCKQKHQVYDFHKNTCVRSECVPGKKATENNTCSSVFERSNVYGYSLCFTMPGNGSIFYRVLDAYDSIVISKMTQLGLYPVHLKIHTNRCLNALNGGFSESVTFSSVVIDFVLVEPQLRDNIDNLIMSLPVDNILSENIVEEITRLYNNSQFYKIPLCDWPGDNSTHEMMGDFSGKEQLKSGRSVNHCSNQTDTEIPHYTSLSIIHKIDNIKRSTIYLPMTNLLLCQFVVVERDEYELNTNDWTISLKSARVSISANKTNIDANGNLRVCMDDYQPPGSWSRPKSEDIHDRIISWMSFVGTLISMLFCLLTFITYCLFKTLRSSAGLNNMILCVNLFLAQGLVQFGADQTQWKEVCTALAILTHFFSLASMVCMTTCTFHMMYALAFPFRFQSHHGNDCTAIKPYILVVISVPTLLVIATVIFSQLDDGSIGYTDSDCFINHGITKQLFYGLPIAVLMLLNLGMYVFTVVHLKRMPKIGETRNDRKKLGLYSRLCVVTGGFWVFGFLYEFTERIVFAYLYILTAPLIGLFLFLAFVVNPRVLELVKVRFRKKKTPSSKDKPHNAKSHQSTGADSGSNQTTNTTANTCTDCTNVRAFDKVFQKGGSANGVSAKTSQVPIEKADHPLTLSVRL